jgi:uncharacterized protein YecE (DUF72 family)
MAKVGPAGWSYPDWAGRVYPRKKPRGFTELGHIASLFDMVEINTSFYRPPPPSMAEGWVRKVPEGFQFTAKIWQRLTHEAAPFGKEEVRPCLEGMAPLKEAGCLAALLAQFPWSFRDTKENRRRIREIREVFADETLIVELRHASWNTDDALEFLRGKEIGFCNIDQPSTSRSITGTRHVTSDAAYIRMHGRNRKAWFDRGAGRDEKYNYDYREEELEEWIEAAREMGGRASKLFIVMNNHPWGHSVVNALQVKAALTGEKLDLPSELVEAFPALRKIAKDARVQRDLFEG